MGARKGLLFSMMYLMFGYRQANWKEDVFVEMSWLGYVESDFEGRSGLEGGCAWGG